MKPKVVFLDGGSLGGMMDLSPLRERYELEVFEQTNRENVAGRIRGAEIVITNKVPIDSEVLAHAPDLKFITVAATGYNNIDLDAATQAGVKVANVKAYSTESVAQLVMAYILNWATSLTGYQQSVRAGSWSTSAHFAMIAHPITELSGKRMGIIGYGAIGRRVAEMARVFGLEVMLGARPGQTYREHRYPLAEVLAKCDIVSIHTPLAPETKNMIAAPELKKMKQGALLVNAARGGIVNEGDLFDALVEGRIYAAVDVLTEEPPRQGNILTSAPNIQLTPHVAWASLESRQRLLQGLISNIESYLNGHVDEVALN